MRHRGVARRISAHSPVMRAIGCSTNSRQDASARCSVSGGAAGFSCEARTAPWAWPSARVKASTRSAALPAATAPAWSAAARGSPANRPDAGTCSRSIAARYLPQPVQFLDQRRDLRVQRSIGGNSGILAPGGFGAVPAGFTASRALARNAPAAPTTPRAPVRWCADSCRARRECACVRSRLRRRQAACQWKTRASPAARWSA